MGQLSTLADVMAYLFSAANAQLLHPDWTAIYGYVAHTVLSRHNLLSEETAVLPHSERGEPTPPEQERLVNLRRDIRQAVVKLARQQEITRPKTGWCHPLPPHISSFQQLAGRLPELVPKLT